jgi:hypothetical protein
MSTEVTESTKRKREIADDETPENMSTEQTTDTNDAIDNKTE